MATQSIIKIIKIMKYPSLILAILLATLIFGQSNSLGKVTV